VITVVIVFGAFGAVYLSASSASTTGVSSDSTTQATSQAVPQTTTQTTAETVTVTELQTTTVCTITAMPGQNSTVEQPTTPCEGPSPTLYQVNFAVTPAGAGTTDPSNGTTLGIQEKGILVQISATANAGYSFTSWTATSASITFGCTTCTTTSAEIDGSGTIAANFAVESGPAYVTQTCSAHGYYQQTVLCTLPSSVNEGQTILVEAAVIPGTNVTDTMGNHYTMLAETNCPCSSTYALEVFSTIPATSGADTISVYGAGNYDAIIVNVLAGVTGVEGTSTGSGTSASPSVLPFQPPSGSLVVGIALINNTEGVYGTTVNAGQGYTLLAAGPDVSDEDAISSGNTTGSQFALQSPEHWAEVSVAFNTGASATPTTTTDAGMTPAVASAATGPLGAILLVISCSALGVGGRPERGAAESGKTALCETPA
jgi:hypothetical protein